VTAQKAGIKNFEMVHAFSQWGLKYAPEIMVEIDGREVPYFGIGTPSDAPEYDCFLRSLMKEMLPLLRSLGLNEKNCYFHVSDEPRECDLENYRYASNLFREILEGFPVIDALSSIKFFKEGLIDRPVPNESELEEFIKEDVAERWVYYAGAWQNGAPGRQLGMPSLRNRVLGILLYVYGCEGFLEWGYNFWFGQFNRTWDVNVWQDTNCDRSFRSGGAYLVYPGTDGPVDSLRHEVIAEDLGYMTDSVRQLVKESGFPGMKVLEFAFDSRDSGSASDYLPHNYTENCVAYTGTHDNETIIGWFDSISEEEREMARNYLCDYSTKKKNLHKSFIGLVMRSKAKTCIIPMQDYLGLDNKFRMNKPSSVGCNWRWRVTEKQLSEALKNDILLTTKTFGRFNWS
jgi:hypothetical protein